MLLFPFASLALYKAGYGMQSSEEWLWNEELYVVLFQRHTQSSQMGEKHDTAQIKSN